MEYTLLFPIFLMVRFFAAGVWMSSLYNKSITEQCPDVYCRFDVDDAITNPYRWHLWTTNQWYKKLKKEA